MSEYKNKKKHEKFDSKKRVNEGKTKKCVKKRKKNETRQLHT